MSRMKDRAILLEEMLIEAEALIKSYSTRLDHHLTEARNLRDPAARERSIEKADDNMKTCIRMANRAYRYALKYSLSTERYPNILAYSTVMVL